MTVSFPWPPRDLSPNARLHPMQKAKAVKAYRKACAWECVAAGLGKMRGDPLHVSVTFHPPDKCRRDLGNMLASIKPGLDGLADVLGVDDHLWSLTIQRADPVPGGRVCIHIQEQSKAVLVPFRGTIS